MKKLEQMENETSNEMIKMRVTLVLTMFVLKTSTLGSGEP